ncbi:hypothetical protein DFH06DRAFT_1316261 [Mycena polygramma]|nr:hypothetical protein DFH06DRAFT_1316261 [Mycena polygramma]
MHTDLRRCLDINLPVGVMTPAVVVFLFKMRRSGELVPEDVPQGMSIIMAAQTPGPLLFPDSVADGDAHRAGVEPFDSVAHRGNKPVSALQAKVPLDECSEYHCALIVLLFRQASPIGNNIVKSPPTIRFKTAVYCLFCIQAYTKLPPSTLKFYDADPSASNLEEAGTRRGGASASFWRNGTLPFASRSD